MCSAPVAMHDTDPYADPTTTSAVAPLRLAIGGYDDDVERHRDIAAAIRTLACACAQAATLVAPQLSTAQYSSAQLTTPFRAVRVGCGPLSTHQVAQ
jgi:hypothetical protein